MYFPLIVFRPLRKRLYILFDKLSLLNWYMHLMQKCITNALGMLFVSNKIFYMNLILFLLGVAIFFKLW